MIYSTGMPGMYVFAPKIICDKCNKEVERCDSDRHFKNNTVMVKVFCHGEEDTCELTYDFLSECRNASVIEARAFKQKKNPEETAEFYRRLLGSLSRHV